MYESCVQNSLSRGRTNYNIGKLVIYLMCANDGCNAKKKISINSKQEKDLNITMTTTLVLQGVLGKIK